ncbi:hypothetical protein ACVB8X_34780 [Streptomyces sp. NRAIS4]
MVAQQCGGARGGPDVADVVAAADPCDGPQLLAPGQSAVIGSDQQYAYRNDDAEPVVFMRVVTGA